MGIAKEGLGGNASAQQAGSPEPRILFNDGGFQTELAGTDGCHITARPSSDDRDIERRLFLQRISLYRTVAAVYDRRYRTLKDIEVLLVEEWIGLHDDVLPGPFLEVVDQEGRSEEHTSELQSHVNLVCRL